MSTGPNISAQAANVALAESFMPTAMDNTAIDADGAPLEDGAGARRSVRTRARSCMSSAPAGAIKRVNAIDLNSIEVEDFTDAKELKQAHDEAHEEIVHATEAAVDNNEKLVLALARMRAIYSQRSTAKLKKESGIKWKSWGSYFRWFKKNYQYKYCLRTVINKIDELKGKKLCTECKKAGGHLPSCSRHPEPIPHFNKADRRALIDGNHKAVEIVTALEAGRDPKEEIAAFKAVMNAKRLDDILTTTEGEAAAALSREFSWQNLTERLETLVPTVEDGNEHVIVDKMETAIRRVQEKGEKADPRVVLLSQRIAANFAAYAKALAPTALVSNADLVNAEEILSERLKQLQQTEFCAEVV